ncbi:MAG TPA: hypothetical protein VN728_11135 [Stellaceae bacterium]|jgi:hypothetical protein|nr:hypothetical protein [Stellaceae bacterium]
MAEYRLYFLDDEGHIQARQGFVAADDADAIESSAFVFDACSDRCVSYELWSGTQLVVQSCSRMPMIRFESLSAARQDGIITLEAMLQQSHWAIANSTRLLRSLEAARGNGLVRPR